MLDGYQRRPELSVEGVILANDQIHRFVDDLMVEHGRRLGRTVAQLIPAHICKLLDVIGRIFGEGKDSP